GPLPGGGTGTVPGKDGGCRPGDWHHGTRLALVPAQSDCSRACGLCGGSARIRCRELDVRLSDSPSGPEPRQPGGARRQGGTVAVAPRPGEGRAIQPRSGTTLPDPQDRARGPRPGPQTENA